MTDKPKKIEIDEKKYRQILAGITAFVELFPDETEKKLKEKRLREKKHKINLDTNFLTVS